MPLTGLKLGFLGGGAMAGALLAGLTGSGAVAARDLYVSDVSRERLELLKASLNINILYDNREVVRLADIIILAVKPGIVLSVLREAAGELKPGQTVISIAAGVPLGSLESAAGGEAAVVRVMPNTPALVGEGASAVCPGTRAGSRDVERALAVFNAVGRAVEVPESMMDAVTGLSGSGPAYMFVILEALADAGLRMGLPRNVAVLLAAQTMLGAAKMLLETGRHPGQLKDMVTTPGGTTIEGLYTLERRGLRGALMEAVEAAAARSRELSGGLK
ncbi:MAG: pyrroline-5-carboxylate reductase [Peptococcaceae bacterium]|nr:pyrroline-5-carboxylate reductase [Peptococcaceae bacterium]